MTARLPELARELAATYEIQNEIGRGGMATVYGARDIKHNRDVAIKVLKDGLALAMGRERFLREIETAASLNHPNILPVHDSGEAAGSLFYVMPRVEGESLRDFLDREKQLPVEQALRITAEIGDALGYAHTRGVVHRDVKPENVMLHAGHAVVADFGIACALDEDGEKKLTETGLSIGTPTYMSPEQGSGMQTDGRSDIYSLGCVLYEMLAGQPPFAGPNPQALLARHSMDAIPSLRTVRPTVSESLEHAIEKALAKAPADRYRTADEFISAIRQSSASIGPARPGSGISRFWQIASAVVAVTGVLAWFFWSTRPPPPAVANRVAMFPFTFTAFDSSLSWLAGDNMVHQLEPFFDGQSGPAAVDPAITLREWDKLQVNGRAVPVDELIDAGAAMGYGLVLTGSIVVRPSEVRMSAVMRNVSDRSVRADVSVTGSSEPDSIGPLIDELATQLLALAAGETRDRLPYLGANLSARQAYLAGRRASRRGAYAEAVRQFETALTHDSTLALAALGLRTALVWTGPDSIEIEEAVEIAGANRSQLGPYDLAILEGFGGGVEHPEFSRIADELGAWRRAEELAPERAEAWFQAGDDLLHYGALMGIEEPLEGAWRAFERAFELDSTGREQRFDIDHSDKLLNHLVDLALARKDTAALRYYLPISLRSQARWNSVHYLMAARLLNDSSVHDSLLEVMKHSPVSVFRGIVESQDMGLDLEDTDRWAEIARQEGFASVGLVWYALNRGRPGEATEVALRDELPDFIWIYDAVYGGADSSGGAAAANSIAARLRQSEIIDSTRAGIARDACALTQWRLGLGDTTAAASTIDLLRTLSAPPDAPASVVRAQTCAVLLEAELGVATGADDTAARISTLDSLLQTVPRLPSTRWNGWNIAAARMWRRLGEPALALAAIRRRVNFLNPAYLASALKEEGYLAVEVGDTLGAIRAFDRYLVLRSDPEPTLVAEADNVRSVLARLTQR